MLLVKRSLFTHGTQVILIALYRFWIIFSEKIQGLREANSTRRTSELELKTVERFSTTWRKFSEAVKRWAATRREFTKTVQRASGTGTERSKAAYGVAAAWKKFVAANQRASGTGTKLSKAAYGVEAKWTKTAATTQRGPRTGTKSSQRQLTEFQQREENSQRQLRETRQQLRNCRGQVSELQLSLSTTQRTRSELHSQEARDWVILRDEIKITEKCLGRRRWGKCQWGNVRTKCQIMALLISCSRPWQWLLGQGFTAHLKHLHQTKPSRKF